MEVRRSKIRSQQITDCQTETETPEMNASVYPREQMRRTRKLGWEKENRDSLIREIDRC